MDSNISLYYEVIVADPYDAMEMIELKENAYVFGMSSISQDDKFTLSLTFKDEKEAELKNKLGRIAAWFSSVNLNSSIVSIKRIERFDTNYQQPQLYHLLSQGTKGTC